MQEGGREIEIAASLDPNNSIARSYLGKAYYEEKRGPLDEREYAIAKELDPKDPTPWFYDAIAKQTTNRPVEALHDMQKAIELNDNRAVYRSRLLLDSDLAARSAALAESTAIWVSSSWGWWKDGNRSTPIRATSPRTDFSPIPTRPCRATRSPGSANCSNRNCSSL